MRSELRSTRPACPGMFFRTPVLTRLTKSWILSSSQSVKPSDVSQALHLALWSAVTDHVSAGESSRKNDHGPEIQG